jgi:PAS domain S-box-containing protein
MAESGSVEREAGTTTLTRTTIRWIAILVVVALGYYLGGRLGLSLALVRAQVTPLWPSSGIAVVSLLFFGRPAVPGILLGAAAVNASLGPGAAAVVGITAGDTLAVVLAWSLLTWAGFRPQLERFRDAVNLIVLGAAGSMLVSAVIGSGTLVVSGAIDGARFWATALVWWVGDAMGVLVVAPVLLAAFALRQASWPLSGPGRWVEAIGLLAAIAVVSLGVATGQVPVLILVFPLLVWGAWRFGITVATPGMLLVSVAATVAAVAARGPFAGIGLSRQMLILQVFNGSAALTVLLLAAAAAEQRATRRAAERAGAELETRVGERTAELAGAVRRLEHSETMFTAAQRAGHVGSWERDLATDKIMGSDELYRLCGLIPQSVEMDYASFLDRVHPDDRPSVVASNEKALRDRRPVTSDFRVVWPDGSVHWLRRRDSVTVDERGNPVTVIGTAQDITATRLAEEALYKSEEETRTMLASVTDAIVGVDGAGNIALVNDRSEELFRYPEHELSGRPVEILLSERSRASHEQHRAAFLAAPQARPMGVGLDLVGRRKDGTEFPADIALRPLTMAGPSYGGTVVVAVVRDVTERRRAELAARELREARLRRRQALEINDTVVQGLTTAMYALERGSRTSTLRTLRSTLATAREMMQKLLGENAAITAGELVRETPATLPSAGEPGPAVPRPRQVGATPRIGLVLADDSTEIRLALRAFAESLSGVDIVGEAVDGAEAIRIVTECRPDVLLLDLAMPVLDGLQALPRIRDASPDTKVIVLSGYGRDQVAKQALASGAVAFVEKGGSLHKLTRLLQDLFPGTIHVDSGMPRDLLDDPAAAPPAEAGLTRQEDIVSVYAHELRSPVAAVSSIVELLQDRIDRLPSSTVNDLLAAMARSLHQLDLLVRAVTDAKRLGEGELDLVLEPTDVGNLLHAVLAELGELTRSHPVSVDIPSGIVTGLDPLRIRQVLTNLISNAVKFSPRDTPIGIAVTEADDTIEITVIDHGPGILPQYRDRLFGKFARFGPGAGLGLGLYICREIAREHGGDIILSDTGPGCTAFVVSLPRFVD